MKPVGVLVRHSCISFLIGVGAATILLDELERHVSLLIGIVLLATIMLGFGLLARYRPMVLIGCLLIGLWYVPFRTMSISTSVPSDDLYSGSIIFSEAQEKKQRLLFRIEEPVRFRGRRLFVSLDRFPERTVGEIVQIRCRIEAPERFDDFAYDRYVARRGVSGLCSYPEFIVLGSRTTVASQLARIRQGFAEYYDRTMPSSEAALLKAMVLNSTGEFPDALRAAFTASGLVHSVSVSGLHMTLLIAIMSIGLGVLGLGKRLQLSVLSIGLVAYLILLGFPAPAVRSSIMGVISSIGTHVGRKVDGVHVLLLTATAMLVENPLALGFDIGFQLSCLALLGMGLTGDWWRYVLRSIPERYGLREVCVATFSAQMYTWPITLYYFGSFSFIAPLANLIALPLFPPLLSLAFIAPLLSELPFVQPSISVLLFAVTKLLTVIVGVFADIPYAAIAEQRISVQWMYGACFLLILCTWWMRSSVYRSRYV